MIQPFFTMLILIILAVGFWISGGYLMKLYQRFSKNSEEKDVHKNFATLFGNSMSLLGNVFVGVLLCFPIYLLIRGIYSLYEFNKYGVEFSFAWEYLADDLSWLYSIIFLIGIIGGVVYFINGKIQD
ncbi:hypothetical protein G3569_18075 [Aliifodinibius halophilus]|uniref:Uncharacterized protein n=2 Tax=Fodinibius halophilus TaxID=1736908 RepID=A0A6M1T7N7_9BACT|nr:hypothetical protein [Fodinibius halophilus]